MYDAQYLPPSFITWEIHSTVPVGFPPSHARTDLLPSSLPFVSDVTITSNDNASLPPLDPQSFANRFVSWDLSFLSEDSSFLLPKSNVIFHLPGDHGDGDVLYCADERGDDIDS
jgi:hypothetical protein